MMELNFFIFRRKNSKINFTKNLRIEEGFLSIFNAHHHFGDIFSVVALCWAGIGIGFFHLSFSYLFIPQILIKCDQALGSGK